MDRFYLGCWKLGDRARKEVLLFANLVLGRQGNDPLFSQVILTRLATHEHLVHLFL